MSFSDIVNSPDFRRTSNAAADTGLKYFFKFMTDALIAIFNFVKSMVLMVLGK